MIISLCCDYDDDTIIVEYIADYNFVKPYCGDTSVIFSLEKSISSIISWQDFSLDDYNYTQSETIFKTIKNEKLKGFRLTLVPNEKGRTNVLVSE